MSDRITDSLAANEPLGTMAVKLGFLTQEQVSAALDEQRRRRSQGENRRLGLLMIEMGLLSAAQLDEVLRQPEAASPPVPEEARKLAARLSGGLRDGDRAVLFTGAGKGIGVTTVCYQVASGLALMDQGHVLIVDANPRSPSLEKIVRQHNPSHRDPETPVPGLTDLVCGRGEFVDALFPTAYRALSLLPTGREEVHFPAMLLSDECARVMRVLREYFRFILIDAPPLLQFPEAALLAPRADAVVMVAAAGQTLRRDVLEMRRVLETLRVPLIASVMVDHATQRSRES